MVTLRRAGWRDAWRLYRWRTDPLTARMMIGPAPTFWQHVSWFRRVQRDSCVRLYIAYDGRFKRQAPIGTARGDLVFDSPNAGTEIHVSMTVAPSHRGRGYAREIIQALEVETSDRFIGRSRPYRWVALVKWENAPSRVAFFRAGYVRYGHALVPGRTASGHTCVVLHHVYESRPVAV